MVTALLGYRETSLNSLISHLIIEADGPNKRLHYILMLYCMQYFLWLYDNMLKLHTYSRKELVSLYTNQYKRCVRCFITQQVGFEITRVNGFTLSDSTHDEVINLMKMRRKLLLSCKGEGLVRHCSYYLPYFCCYSCWDVARAKVSLSLDVINDHVVFTQRGNS